MQLLKVITSKNSNLFILERSMIFYILDCPPQLLSAAYFEPLLNH